METPCPPAQGRGLPLAAEPARGSEDRSSPAAEPEVADKEHRRPGNHRPPARSAAGFGRAASTQAAGEKKVASEKKVDQARPGEGAGEKKVAWPRAAITSTHDVDWKAENFLAAFGVGPQRAADKEHRQTGNHRPPAMQYEPDAHFEELERGFENQYELEEVLGEGGYGKMYKARNKRSGQTVAMKKMKMMDVAQEMGIPSAALRDVALLKELGHENIVRLEEVFYSPKKLVLVYEFVESDLAKYMRSLNRQLTPAVIKNLTYQLCRGTEFLHASRIIHRGIKPQNLLIEQLDGGRVRLKVADFGLARTYSIPVPKYTHEVVTLWYRPLEILLGSPLYRSCSEVDLWSIGCVAAEMATGSPLFAGSSEIGTVFKIFQKLGTARTEQWPGLADLPGFNPTFPKWPHRGWDNIRNTQAQMGSVGIELLGSLMTYDPKKRLSAQGALLHPYLSDVERRAGF